MTGQFFQILGFPGTFRIDSRDLLCWLLGRKPSFRTELLSPAEKSFGDGSWGCSLSVTQGSEAPHPQWTVPCQFGVSAPVSVVLGV